MRGEEGIKKETKQKSDRKIEYKSSRHTKITGREKIIYSTER